MTMKNVLPEVPAVIPVGGSKVSGERVVGAPSKLYPLLRDLAESVKLSVSKPVITIEVDTEDARTIGTIKTLGSMSNGKGQALYLTDAKIGDARALKQHGLAFHKIIAVRVLAIEVPDDVDLPIRL